MLTKQRGVLGVLRGPTESTEHAFVVTIYSLRLGKPRKAVRLCWGWISADRPSWFWEVQGISQPVGNG